MSLLNSMIYDYTYVNSIIYDSSYINSIIYEYTYVNSILFLLLTCGILRTLETPRWSYLLLTAYPVLDLSTHN